MQTPDVTLPALTDHPEYASCVANLEKLQAELALARTEVSSAGVVSASADSYASDDIDKGVERFFREEKAAKESRVRAEIRCAALERAIGREKNKLPELFRMAVDAVGRAASEQHSAVVADLLEHRRKVSELWSLQHQICCTLRATINDPTAPGYLSFDQAERYAWPPPMVSIFGHPELANEAAFTAVQGFKQVVHEPLKKEAVGVITRFREFLTRSGQ